MFLDYTVRDCFFGSAFDENMNNIGHVSAAEHGNIGVFIRSP